MNEIMTIEVTPDKMLGVVSFKAESEDGIKLTGEAIEREIAKKGICFGLQKEVIEEIKKTRREGFKYIIAKGQSPQRGVDASIKFYFDPVAINVVKPTQKADGTVDFKSLNIVHNVAKDTVLAEKIPSQPGVDGKDVLGNSIKAQPGKDVRMPRGKNTGFDATGQIIRAEMDGRLCYDGHNIYISPLFIIEKDVDSSTGNIDFVGNVLVNGSVKNGYSIKAGGNIEIHGSVEAAHIEAVGDIAIWYGIQGMDRGSIKAGGNIVAKFIQNAKVEATGDLTAEAIMHSTVAANNIYVDKGKGLIVGGEIEAAQMMYVNTLGSAMATQTAVQLGIPPHLVREYKEIEKQYITSGEELQKVSQSITYLTARQAQGQLEPDKVELLRKLFMARQEIQNKKQELKKKYDELAMIIQTPGAGFIKVKNVMHPGVKITIGNAMKYIKEDYHYCMVSKEEGDISIGLY